mmetsp:Transcript_17301/g.37333  ORF Transcript_17301/g.37333 Transcript_17301/m.37333 type:complete len:368 (-) Transcript_17301:641-1744(-)|eukprot:CAMPEP_0202915568 /NCGR_PEP_ID=MMETSP1392-20130828/66013_1 /ASSEMBLY_ACC=CAM_ASM_000868 /TAXON_ID=225041 /ORGANISM="Chlamydomonas chlamydogama, Strain SAG 11-48b" /LENGTH=367 /DNA_ID=CAMNT_0049607651 /DNA_START=85 /DNA_END=1188 /DNA_ORIENTATION=-
MSPTALVAKGQMPRLPAKTLSILALAVVCLFSLQGPVAHGCKVLQIVTNVGNWTPTTGPAQIIGKPKSTGYWLVEFTHSYTYFKSRNCSITVASPKGGVGPADPQGFAFYAADPLSQALIAKRPDGSQYVPLTEDTMPASQITNKTLASFDIVFYVGGTGGMWDYPYDENLQRIAAYMWESNKVVSAVCHGPMALTNVRLTNGEYLVSGKLMTGFSNDEEEVLGTSNYCALCYPGGPPDGCPTGFSPSNCTGPHMPTEYYAQGTYLLESKLKERGAMYVGTEQDWKTYYFRPHVVRHGRLVTGQNPGAGYETAEAAYDTYIMNKRKRRCKVTTQFADTFCTPIQQSASDPPVKCKTAGYLPNCGSRD